jgi:hypothetical protein
MRSSRSGGSGSQSRAEMARSAALIFEHRNSGRSSRKASSRSCCQGYFKAGFGISDTFSIPRQTIAAPNGRGMVHRNHSYTPPPRERFKCLGIVKPNHEKLAPENGPMGRAPKWNEQIESSARPDARARGDPRGQTYLHYPIVESGIAATWLRRRCCGESARASARR